MIMIKMYCDFCGSEIAKDADYFSVTLKPEAKLVGDPPLTGIRLSSTWECCKECFSRVAGTESNFTGRFPINPPI